MPWGALKTHKEICAYKSDAILTQYCTNLQHTEYHPLSYPIQLLLSMARDRTLHFSEQDYFYIFGIFTNALHACGWTHDSLYDWNLA